MSEYIKLYTEKLYFPKADKDMWPMAHLLLLFWKILVLTQHS